MCIANWANQGDAGIAEWFSHLALNFGYSVCGIKPW